MASMNNWLGFSSSPQEIPSQVHSQNSVPSHGFISERLSGADFSGECFDLISYSTLPYLNLPMINNGMFWTAQNLSHSQSLQSKQSNCAINETVHPKLIYRGVRLTRHRWISRYEAYIWDNSSRSERGTRNGRQGAVYLGAYDSEETAARVYDLAALKYWGINAYTNFPVSNYEKELEEMKYMTRQEYVASLRRKSPGFSRGASIYRGVTRNHPQGRWKARFGRVSHLGTFDTEEEAAEAYDIAAIRNRGLNASTNFDIGRYDVKTILVSSTLPTGEAANLLQQPSFSNGGRHQAPGYVLANHEEGNPPNNGYLENDQLIKYLLCT